MKIWTLTLEGRRQPFLEHIVEDDQAAETIRRTVERATAAGYTVIVNVISDTRNSWRAHV
jgi:hypothetical protein